MHDLLPDWTETPEAERAAKVRALATEGKPASLIARSFRNCTRNTIIGYCSRRKIQLKGRTPKPPAPPKKPKPPKVEARIDVRQVSAARAKGPQFNDDPDGLLDLGNDVTALIGSILDLNEHTCKWPIGDPLKPGFGFCGRHSIEGSPYCAAHHDKAYLGTHR
jgi:GcrA cell cycle regulator